MDLFDLLEATPEPAEPEAAASLLSEPAAPAFALYPYQGECLEAIGQQFLGGIWSQIAIIPTGGGKTEVFSRLRLSPLRPWLDSFPRNDRRVLVLAHREELLDQAAKKFRRANPDLSIGIEKAERRASDLDDVVIASVQTMQGRRLKEFDPDRFRVVIVDEAHHAPADTYQATLRHFGLLPPADLIPKNPEADQVAAREALQSWWAANPPNRLLLGVTATPARGDAIGLEWTFQSIVFERTLRWMIENGYLAPLRGFMVNTQLSLDAVKMTAGDFNQGQLAKTVNTPERNRIAVAAWLQECPGRKTLAFSVDIQHAKDLAAAASAQGIAADWIAGEDPDRSAKLRRFREGKLLWLANAQLLTEGFDEPNVSAILMAKPTTSSSLYMQMIGRGTRLAEGKADCVVLDVVDVSKKRSLQTIGDLFGLPAKFDLRGSDALKAVQEIEQLQERREVALEPGMSIELVRRLITSVDLWAVKESETVKRFAGLQWIEDSPQRFHLPLPKQSEQGALESGDRGGPQERIELVEDVLGGWKIQRRVGPMFEELGRAGAIAEAFRKAERWVESFRPDVYRMKDRNAKWLGKKATEKQRELLRKQKFSRWDDPDLSRGEASAALDRLMARWRK